MTAAISDFLRILDERGFIQQVSDTAGLDAKAVAGGLTGYIGFDATATSLHVGSLVQIMMLRWLQETGGRPIALMGGGTSRIGDPSFRDEARKLLGDDDIARNLSGIRQVFDKFLRFGDGPGDALMIDNATWLNHLNYSDFLRDYGRHFSVNRMLSFESVKTRLDREQSLSFLEFNYMIFQAYDFVELHRRHGCVMQMGGSDQWGNIVNGIELGRRTDNAALYGVTSPLITLASGAKMGKSAAGAVWLNADLLAPYEYWQFWRNTEDADVGRFLKLFTLMPLAEIAKLDALQGAEINEAKKVLATETTALLHGRHEAERAAETASRTFEQGVAASGLPSVERPRAEFETGIGIAPAFVLAGLTGSNSEVVRAISGGAISVNDERVTDRNRVVGIADLSNDGIVKLSFGRKKHVLLRAV